MTDAVPEADGTVIYPEHDDRTTLAAFRGEGE
jgi:hypothetical protein